MTKDIQRPTLANIVETTMVPHTKFQEATSRLAQYLSYAEEASEPICAAIIGESRTGKSRALEEVYTRSPRERTADGLLVPILRVKTPSKPTVKSLAELMLRELGDPKFDKGTENAKTLRLKTLMRNVRTRMVMIDEFQHFYDKGSHKVMHHVADWLKILVDDSNVALVVAGLPTCRAVLDQNEQLAGRFVSPIVMPRFDWQVEDHRNEFVGILGAFNDSLGRYFQMPELADDEMAFRCYCATGGLMGYLTKFLRQAVWNALDYGRSVIALEDLVFAHDQAVWARDGLVDLPSPFSRAFTTDPTEELLAMIRTIGTPSDEFIKMRSRVKAKSRSLQSVLVAS